MRKVHTCTMYKYHQSLHVCKICHMSQKLRFGPHLRTLNALPVISARIVGQTLYHGYQCQQFVCAKSLRAHLPSRIHYIKRIHECLPTTVGQQIWRDNGTSTCPKCTSTYEDGDHIITCGSSTRAEWWEKCCNSSCKFHQKHNVAPDLQQLSDMTMTQWLNVSEGE
jgi:hypothetical protein